MALATAGSLPGSTWTQYFQHSQIRQTVVPPPLTLTNNFTGGVAGVSVTTANSGGVSGNIFNNAPIGGGGTLQYSAAEAIHGNPLSVFTQTTTANVTGCGWTSSIVYSQHQLWCCIYMLFPALPAGVTRFYTTSNGGGGTSRFVVLTNGTIQVQDTNGTAITTSANTIPLGQWFRVEGYTVFSQGTGSTEVKLFSNLDNLVPLETNTSGSTFNTGFPANSTIFGPNAGVANQGPYYIGYVGISNIGYLGPVAQPTYIPQLESNPGQTWQKNFQHRQLTYLTTPDINIGAPTVNIAVAENVNNLVTVSQNIAVPNISVATDPNNTIVETLSGATSAVSVASPAGTVNEILSGVTANINVASPAGTINEFISGVTSTVNSAAPAGNINETLTGVVANVNTTSSGNLSVAVSANSATISVVAVPGTLSQNTNVAGITSVINVAAPQGAVTISPDGTWWRVYPSYRSYPA